MESRNHKAGFRIFRQAVLLAIAAFITYSMACAEDAKVEQPAPAPAVEAAKAASQKQESVETGQQLQEKINELYHKAKDYFDSDQLDLAQETFSKIPELVPDDLRAKDYLDNKIPARKKELGEVSTKEEKLRKEKETQDKIASLYKEGIKFFDTDQLDLAADSFNKILIIDPKQQKAKDYLEQKIPKKTKDFELAAKKAEEEKLRKEEELKKQQYIASGRAELENLKKEMKALELKAKQLNLKEKEIEELKSNLQNLTLAREDLKEQELSLKKERDELKKKSELTETEMKKLKNLNTQLEAKAKEFFLKSQDAEKAQEDLEGLSRAIDVMNKERLALQKKNKELEKRSKQASAADGEYFEELGTAYTKARLYDKAIEAYNKVLSFNSDNAQVHYYLGLLYKHSNGDRKKAIYHLKKYLGLAQIKVKERREIEYLIEMLEEAPKHEVTPSFKN